VDLSRRGFLSWLGAAAASAGVLIPARELLAAEPVRVLINREEYYVYEWDHILGPLSEPDVLLRDTGEWGEWWKDKVCYDRQNNEILVPKFYKDEIPFWGFTSPHGSWYDVYGKRCTPENADWHADIENSATPFMPENFLTRWCHLKGVQDDIELTNPLADLSRAFFSNPKLYQLARRWKPKPSG
jgi:hypothetical protein